MTLLVLFCVYCRSVCVEWAKWITVQSTDHMLMLSTILQSSFTRSPFKASEFASWMLDWCLSVSLALVALCSVSSCSRLWCSDRSLNVKSISWLFFSYSIKGDIRFLIAFISFHPFCIAQEQSRVFFFKRLDNNQPSQGHWASSAASSFQTGP